MHVPAAWIGEWGLQWRRGFQVSGDDLDETRSYMHGVGGRLEERGGWLVRPCVVFSTAGEESELLRPSASASPSPIALPKSAG
jgi:hypothetical protein